MFFLGLLTFILLLAAFFLWRFSISAQNTLDTSIRQYEQIQTKLDRYLSLSQNTTQLNADKEDLFAQVNRMAAQCGISSRLENLRPAGKGDDSMEIQLRSLYLGETVRFISLIEALEIVNIERLVMRRSLNNLLDLEVQIKRKNNAQ